MTPKPSQPIDEAELREKLVNDVLLRLETSILATRGDSYHRAYARNEAVNEIVQLFAQAVTTVLKRVDEALPEELHPGNYGANLLSSSEAHNVALGKAHQAITNELSKWEKKP